jgi:prepilin-type N-terminal cleavage/methylation domain-containing protein
MKNKNQSGFSLIELLLVVVIVGVIAAIGIPLLTKGIHAAENSSTNATLKIMVQTQALFYAQKNRYARLDEVNAINNGTLGTIDGDKLFRGNFEYEMVPANPTDEELKATFRIKATRYIGDPNLPYVMEITPQGYVSEIFP